jgi:hypothetical protein
MSKVNGKQKGNSFERKIANLLSDRFKEITGIESAFRRNPDSGSFFGGQNQSRTDTYDTEYAIFGDLICPKNFNFSIECKNYKTPPSFNAIMKQDCKQLDTWIAQAEQDAANAKKIMALIVKYNNVQEFVVIKGIFGTLKPVINYKDYHLVTLDDFLSQDDGRFFNMTPII